jgi:hypothetical protein
MIWMNISMTGKELAERGIRKLALTLRMTVMITKVGGS